MAPSTITLLSNSLRRSYADRYFKALQEDFTPLLDELDECPDDPTYGVGWFFPFYLATPQNWKVNAEAGDMGTVQQRSEIQGQVNCAEFLGWFQISEMLKNAGMKSGAWNGGELARQTDETSSDITKGMQRMFTISHGTGRLAVVQDATVGINTFVAKNPEGVQGLKVNDLIDFVDLDTGGTVQAGQSPRRITAINRATRTVTISAVATLSANWGVYKSGSYTAAFQPNGLHGCIDDGTNTDNAHGQSVATNPGLKSVVLSASGTPGTAAPLTTDLMQRVSDGIYHNGGEIDALMCNTGVMKRIHALQEGDLRYNIERGKTAKMVLGFREGDLLWNYDKGSYVVRKNPNVPARSLYFYSLKRGFYKHTLRKLGWLDEKGSILHLAPGSGGLYGTSWIAMICAQVNISCYARSWQGEIRDIEDTLAGDTITT